MSGLFSSIIQSNSTSLPETHEVSLCGMKSLSQKSIISWTEGGEVLSVARSVSLFVAIVPYPGRKCNELNRSSGTWCQFSTESVLSLGLTIRSGGGDVLYWAHYDPAGQPHRHHKNTHSYTFHRQQVTLSWWWGGEVWGVVQFSDMLCGSLVSPTILTSTMASRAA